MDNSTANLNPGIPQPIDQTVPSVQADPGAVYGGSSSKKKIIGIVVGIILLIVVGVGVFSLIKPKPVADAEITYWGIWENEATFNEIIQEFEAQNPGITINYEKRTDIKDAPGGGYLPFLRSRMEAGTGPDIFQFHPSWLYFLQGYLAPFPADVAERIYLSENYFPAIVEDMESGGAYYGVPIGYDSLVMFVNDELLTAGGYSVPQDWTTFLDVARDLTVVDPQTGEILTAGTAMGTYDNVAHAADIMSLIIVQKGINLSDLAGLGTESQEERERLENIAKEKMVDALRFYTCFAIQNEICIPIWNQDMPNSKLAFVQGRVAFYFGYSWDMLEINGANPDLSYSVHSVPKLTPTGVGASTLSGYWAEGVSVRSKAQPQAFKFLEFLSSKENMEKIFKSQVSQRAVGVAYPRRDMANLLTDHVQLSPIISQADTARSSIFYSDTYGGGEIAAIDGYLGNAVRSIVSEKESIESAVDTLAKGLNQVYTRNNEQVSAQ